MEVTADNSTWAAIATLLKVAVEDCKKAFAQYSPDAEDPLIRITKICEKTGWSPRTFYRRLEEYGWETEPMPGYTKFMGVRKSVLLRDLGIDFS